MTTDRDPRTHLVLSWLREDLMENAERVLLLALDEVDATPQRRSWWAAWRTSSMNPLRLAIAAAALVVAVIAAYNQGPGNPTLAPTLRPTALLASPAPASTAIATANPMPPETNLSPGRYFTQVPGSEIRVEFTVGAGWTSSGGGVSTPDWYIDSANGSVSFWSVASVPADACEWIVPGPSTGPTVDDLVNAMEEQENSETTVPVDVTVGGYSGKRFAIAPAASVPCEELLWWWLRNDERGRGAAAGETTPDTVYAIDVAGERIVIVAYERGPHAIFADIIDSMAFVRP
jgi:hypothetical protein